MFDRRHRLSAAAISLCALAAGSATAGGLPTYRALMLPFPLINGWGGGYVKGLNAAGDVIGSILYDQSHFRAVIWPAATHTYQFLPVENTTGSPVSTYAYGINQAGQVVGEGLAPVKGVTTQWALRWNAPDQPGQLLSKPGPLWGYASAINDAGVTLGAYYGLIGEAGQVFVPPVTLLWSPDGSMQDIGSLTSSAARPYAAPGAIDAAGMVVGTSRTLSGDYRAYQWTAATGMQALPLLSGLLSSEAHAIDGKGNIAGISYGPGPVYPWHFTLWPADRTLPPRDLGALTLVDPSYDYGSTVISMSDNGLIFGNAQGGYVKSIDSGEIDYLSHLIDPSDPNYSMFQHGNHTVTIGAANASGVICGTVYYGDNVFYPFLLFPE